MNSSLILIALSLCIAASVHCALGVKCFECSSSPYSAAVDSGNCLEAKETTLKACCQDPFDTEANLKDEGGITASVNSGDCRTCLKVKYSWKDRPDDTVYYERKCVKENKDVSDILTVTEDGDADARQSAEDDAERRQEIEKETRQIVEDEECVEKKEETPSGVKYIEACGCRIDYCNGVERQSIKSAFWIFTSLILAIILH